MRERTLKKESSGRRNSLPLTQIHAAPLVPTNATFEFVPSDCIVPLIESDDCAADCRELLQLVNDGCRQAKTPQLCEEGVNGTYFLKDREGRIVAVFKPEDEQGNTPINPKQENCTPSNNDLQRKGLVEGEISLREVAAYLLDKYSGGFYGVPRTCLVKMIIPEEMRLDEDAKIGSIQQFVDADGSAFDVGPSTFGVRDVHKIGILDIRIFNTDRHMGNILIQQNRGGYALTPIDHSYSLPHSLDAAWFDWLNWPQSKVPFDPETRNHILSINTERDDFLLRTRLGIRPECLLTMKISTALLQKGVQCGLTLFEIGSMICRRNLDQPSDLEMMCCFASQQIGMPYLNAGMSQDIEQLFLSRLYTIMEESINQYFHRWRVL